MLERRSMGAITVFAMLLGALFLLVVGAGPWSTDALLSRRKTATQQGTPPHG